MRGLQETVRVWWVEGNGGPGKGPRGSPGEQVQVVVTWEPPSPVKRRTSTTENITFPQLLWRVVIMIWTQRGLGYGNVTGWKMFWFYVLILLYLLSSCASLHHLIYTCHPGSKIFPLAVLLLWWTYSYLRSFGYLNPGSPILTFVTRWISIFALKIII